jgi:glutaredoxin
MAAEERIRRDFSPGSAHRCRNARQAITRILARMRFFIRVQNENITTDSGGIIISDTTQFIVYTLEFCPNCEILKEFLASRGVPFVECDMASAEALTELRMNGIFVQEAPVLQKGDAFYTSADLFAGGAFREDLVADLIAEA